MNFFTPPRYVALQDCSSDAAMDAADAEWQEAVRRYDAHLEALWPDLPPSVRQLVEGFYLHDAAVLSMGRQGDSFVVELQLDVPPHELLTISFDLAGEPWIDRDALPAKHCSPSPRWLYEELERAPEGGQPGYLLSFLLSNGWEVRVPFRSVHLRPLQPVYPAPRTRPALAGA
jgi:hypothetical protein